MAIVIISLIFFAVTYTRHSSGTRTAAPLDTTGEACRATSTTGRGAGGGGRAAGGAGRRARARSRARAARRPLAISRRARFRATSIYQCYTCESLRGQQDTTQDNLHVNVYVRATRPSANGRAFSP